MRQYIMDTKHISILILFFYICPDINIVTYLRRYQARSQGGSGGQLTPPLENQRSTFWNLTREIIKANNYKGKKGKGLPWCSG